MAGEYLGPGFTFTQTALRTYQECPYHFYLRYLAAVPWPAFPPTPAGEAALERGRRFHELARQRFLGLDVSTLVAGAGEEIAAWWAALQASPLELDNYPRHYPEAGLSVPLGHYRLAARYDLLAVGEGQARIVDWKTGRPLPALAELAGDVQTRVYLCVLAEGGAVYNAGRPFSPEKLSMVYWHPQGPQQVRLAYSAAQRTADRAFLEGLVAEITACPPEKMCPTADEAACARCAYAPLCGREEGGTVEWEVEEDPTSEAETWPGE